MMKKKNAGFAEFMQDMVLKCRPAKLGTVGKYQYVIVSS